MPGKKIAGRYLAAASLLFAALFAVGCAQDEADEPKLVRLAAPEEFVTAAAGLPAMSELYGFHFDEVYHVAIGLTHEALRAGDVEAALGYATDGKIEELKLIALIDDQGFFPAGNAAPVIRNEILSRHPKMRRVLSGMRPYVHNRIMVQMNYNADIEGTDPYDLVLDWLLQNGLLCCEPEEIDAPDPVIIGSKGYLEQELLVTMTAMKLQDAGIPVEVRVFPAGTRAVRSALVQGDIDMYWEYIGTAWQEIFEEEEVIADSDELFARIAKRDAALGLTWLYYTPLNNSPAFLMRREKAQELGIYTITRFAVWARAIQEERF